MHIPRAPLHETGTQHHNTTINSTPSRLPTLLPLPSQNARQQPISSPCSGRMVSPGSGIRHLRPLASSSASKPVSAHVSVSAALDSVPLLAPAVPSDRTTATTAAAAAACRAAVTTIAVAANARARAHAHHGRYRRHHHHSSHRLLELPPLTLTPLLRACHGLSIRPLLPPPSPHLPLQVRGKKTTTTIRLSDLPQGLIQPTSPPPASSTSPAEPQDAVSPLPLPPLPQDPPPYPTVVLQARQNMRRFDNCVLLTRVGGFYELYFEHADEYGPLLNLKVASKKTSAGPVPMVSSLLPSISSMLDPLAPCLIIIICLVGRVPLLPTGSIPQNSRPRPQPSCCHRRRVPQLTHGQGQVWRADARPQSRPHHHSRHSHR